MGYFGARRHDQTSKCFGGQPSWKLRRNTSVILYSFIYHFVGMYRLQHLEWLASASKFVEILIEVVRYEILKRHMYSTGNFTRMIRTADEPKFCTILPITATFPKIKAVFLGFGQDLEKHKFAQGYLSIVHQMGLF
jgi:hypothetical protein